MRPHRFDAKHKGALVDEERQRIQPAEGIIDRGGIPKGEVCADLGCGIGYITIPVAAVAAGILAMDSQKEMLGSLVSRLPRQLRNRVYPLVAEMPELPLIDGSVDRVYAVNVLHEVEDKAKLAAEVGRVLRRNGRLSLVDFQKRQTSFGPPLHERLTEEEAARIFSGMTLIGKYSFEEFYQMEFENK